MDSNNNNNDDGGAKVIESGNKESKVNFSKYHSYSAKYKHSLVLSGNNEGGNNGIQASQKELMSTFKYKTVKTPRVKVEPTIDHLFPSQATNEGSRVKVSKSKSKLHQLPKKQQQQQLQPQPIESMSNMIPFSPYQILNSFVDVLPQIDIDTNTISNNTSNVIDTKNKKRVKSQLMMDSLTERYLSN